MDQHPDARLREQAAHQAAANAHLRLFLALDDALSYGGPETFRIPTNVLLALDAAREAEAALFQFLPEPGITSAQVEDAWQHAVEQAEALTAGPTQDQEPCSICGFKQDQEPLTIEQQYENGLLSLGEYQHLVEAADIRNTVAWITEKLS